MKAVFTLLLLAVSSCTAELHVGTGIADATGPISDVIFMGST